MKKHVKVEAAVTTGVGEGHENAPVRTAEPTIYDKLDSFKKEIDAIADLCRGGRWNRAIRNLKDMTKDVGTLAKDLHAEYLEEIEV